MKSSSERNYEPSGAANTGGLAPFRDMSIDHCETDRVRGWVKSSTKTAPDDRQGLLGFDCNQSNDTQSQSTTT